MALLAEYSQIKGFESPLDAIRNIINGVEPWIARNKAALAARAANDVTNDTPNTPPQSSLPSKISSDEPMSRPEPAVASSPTTSIQPSRESEDRDESSRPLGDFGGRTNVGIPSIDGMNDEND